MTQNSMNDDNWTPELDELRAHDFPGDTVTVRLEDGSVCAFRNAFARQEGPDQKWTVLYTEHCGYHVFPTEAIQSTTDHERPPEIKVIERGKERSL